MMSLQGIPELKVPIWCPVCGYSAPTTVDWVEHRCADHLNPDFNPRGVEGQS